MVSSSISDQLLSLQLLMGTTEFCTFVEETEKELLALFKSIDYNNDGKLSKPELRAALSRAGLSVPNSSLDTFFAEVDTNNDGHISFDEWRYVSLDFTTLNRGCWLLPDTALWSQVKSLRGLLFDLSIATSDPAFHHFCSSLFCESNMDSDFLLFIPVSAPNLQAVMSYFSATMKMNPEGDVQISDDTIQGLGTTQHFLHSLFGSLLLIAHTPPYTSFPSNYSVPVEMALPPAPSLASSHTLPPRLDEEEPGAPLAEVHTGLLGSIGTVLIACVPHTGYFVAGGIAGIVSRTSTAPLDRLKVYLIAQTGATKEAVSAAKSGNIFRAALNAWKPLATATKELWQAGGMRSLYAGKFV